MAQQPPPLPKCECIVADTATLFEHAATRILAHLRAAHAHSRLASLVLCGGTTPRNLYQLLACDPWRQQIPWQSVRIFWGDERYVPHDHPDSSYGMARTTLLDHVPIPTAQIFPIPTHYENPADAARAYERQLIALQHNIPPGMPLFDVVLLGMGADGHTASLFPNHPALDAPPSQLVVLVEDAPKPPPTRISLSYAALNRAGHGIILVTGSEKAATLRTVLSTSEPSAHLPITLVRPPHGHITWLVDEAAGTHLQ